MIAFITIHPANYISNLAKYHLTKFGKADVIYLNGSIAEKPWRELIVNKPIIFSLRKIKGYDEIIFPGWYNWKVIFFYIFCKMIGKRVSLFIDHIGKNTFIPFYVKLYLSLSHNVYSASYTLSELLNANKIKNFILPYGLTFEELYERKFKVEVSEIKSRKRLFIANRFIERKGWRTFVSSLRRINHNQIDKLVVAGGGPICQEIIGELKSVLSDVDYLGWVELTQYRKTLINSDLFLHLSDFEPFGVPPLDAFLLGKIIVVSDSVFSMLPFKGLNGVYMFVSGDYLSLASAINSALAKNDLINIEERYRDYCRIYLK
jgi:glycosyltransferase involved in cell wall biosynthesis